jgi:8-oxo-dGTP diphosphatase
MKRHYPEQPLVGVAAVIFKGEEVLLVRRGQEPAKGVWSLPGGLVEVGETLVEGVQREIIEETGLIVRILGVTAVLERIYRDPDDRIPYHYILIDFACEYEAGDLRPGSDIDDARFVAAADLNSLDLPEFTARVIQRAREQREQGNFLPLL